jgi:hypothetical protein
MTWPGADLIRKSWRALKGYQRRPIQPSKAVLPPRSHASSHLSPPSSHSTAWSYSYTKRRCELLTVPDHPRIPLHTSGLENAVPRQVSQRKVGGGRDRDRNRRDRLLDLAKAGDKLKVLFWDCLGVGPAVPSRQALPPASELTFTGARSP